MNVDDILNESSSDSSEQSSAPPSDHQDQESDASDHSSGHNSAASEGKDPEAKDGEGMKKSLSSSNILENQATEGGEIQNEMALEKELMRAKRATLQDSSKFKTFTDGKQVDSGLDQNIFEDGLGICQSPSKIIIDNPASSHQKDSSLNDSKKVEKQIEQKIRAEGDQNSPAIEPQSSQKQVKQFNEDDEISEDERRRILDEINLDSSSDEEESSEEESGSSEQKESSDKGKEDSISDDSIQELTNKSIDSGPSELQAVADPENYLPFISDKYALSNDILEVIDRNERSFKVVAEKMIQKSSQLDVQPQYAQDLEDGSQIQRRLMRFEQFDKIAERFHGDVKVAQGVPYCIGALENFIAIGSSDGSVRLFDTQDEREIKSMTTKDLKGNAVFSLDLKRVRGNNSIFVVAGHAKGQVSLYEVKGLPKRGSVKHQELLNMVSFKHLRTVSDTHKGQVVQVKFYGEFKKDNSGIQVVSCDINGTIYLSKYVTGVLGYSCQRQCLWRERLKGAAFSICPLFYDFYEDVDGHLGIFNKESNPYDYSAQDPSESSEEIRNQIIAFGALERIVVAQVAPSAQELFSIERPDYIEPQTVAYLDWGRGLSPLFRDTTYPILAIAWGRTIQLAIWTNHQNKGELPQIKFDGFYICDGFSIDQCFFLDESLLFVLVNKRDVRILYTQHFTPGIFDEKILLKPEQNSDPTANKKQFLKKKEQFTGLVSTYAEVDKGYRLLEREEIRHKDIITINANQLRSKFNFNPSITKNFDGSVFALGKSTVCQGKLLHWEEYLDLVQLQNPDDWLKVLRAALDIFSGKMVGLAGLPDVREEREKQLKEAMKDLLRENIDLCIKEFQEGQMVQSKTLRVATEFCIKVGAIDHLFGELFSMFAEAGIEQRYFENLEAFILSGKLKQIPIPARILTRIIQYYRQKDVELLEKSILNLNLHKYPNNLEVRHICEEELLSSALIHMLTTIFDQDKNMENTVCLHVLCALFNLMNKSKVEASYEEVLEILSVGRDSTILFEANQHEDKDTDPEAEQARQEEREKQKQLRSRRLEVEHSKTYIGYKLMWVVRLFLEGKKFPSGTLSSFKWRMYVFDIVRFITTPQFLKWFLNFDGHRFFQLILPLFNDQEPFQYIITQKSFVEMYKHEVAGLEECGSHNDILRVIQESVSEIVARDREQNAGVTSKRYELLENSYMFFISKISKRGGMLNIETQLYQSTILKQLKFHRKLLKLDVNIGDLIAEKVAKEATSSHKELSQAIQNQKFMSKPTIAPAFKEKDRSQALYLHLIKKNEQDVLTMIQRLEDQEGAIDEDVLKEFCKEADSCPMFMVRVHLHELLQNYQKCLSLFFKIAAIKPNVFEWLRNIHANFSGSNQRSVVEQMRALILKNITSFVEMDTSQSVTLCFQWFEGQFAPMVAAISTHATSQSQANELSFRVIDKILELKEAQIKEQFQRSVVTGQAVQGPSEEYQALIYKLVEILCEKKYRKLAMVYVEREYFPVDKCLEICERKGVRDALAALQKRKGNYREAVRQLILVLTDLSKQKIISALFINAHVPFNSEDTKNADIKRFDALMSMIIDICANHGSRLLPEKEAEDLWLSSINQVFGIKQEVMDELCDLEQKDLDNFQVFLLIRIQAFMMQMSEFVHLERIINFLQEINQQSSYQEFQPTFEEKVKRETYHQKILLCASDLVIKDLLVDVRMLDQRRSRGCVAGQLRCDQCGIPFQTKWARQQVQMFKCGHNFHQLCLKDGKSNCTLCFDEYDNIQKIINSRNKASVGIRGRPDRSHVSHSSTAATSDSESDGEVPERVGRGSVTQNPFSSQGYEEQAFDKFTRQLQRFELNMAQRELYFEAE